MRDFGVTISQPQVSKKLLFMENSSGLEETLRTSKVSPNSFRPSAVHVVPPTTPAILKIILTRDKLSLHPTKTPRLKRCKELIKKVLHL